MATCRFAEEAREIGSQSPLLLGRKRSHRLTYVTTELTTALSGHVQLSVIALRPVLTESKIVHESIQFAAVVCALFAGA